MKIEDHKPLPSLALLNKYFEYFPESGLLIWKINKGSAKKGSPAGCVHPSGYRRVKINGEFFCVHRLVWFMSTGVDPETFTVDHINENRSDNRLVNLRLATCSQQQRYKSATLGYWRTSIPERNYQAWKAYISYEGVIHHLGTYHCPLLARLAYEDKFIQLLGFKPNFSEKTIRNILNAAKMSNKEIPKETIDFISGRLCGLSGSTRYKIPDALRVELKNLAALLAGQEVSSEFSPFK